MGRFCTILTLDGEASDACWTVKIGVIVRGGYCTSRTFMTVSGLGNSAGSTLNVIEGRGVLLTGSGTAVGRWKG